MIKASKFYLFLLLPLLFSCGNSREKDRDSTGAQQKESKSTREFKPGSSGDEFEVLIIGDRIRQRKKLQIAVDSVFHSLYPGLAQPEGWFSTSFLNAENFSSVHKKHKSLLFLSSLKNSPNTLQIMKELITQEKMNKKLQPGKTAYVLKKDAWARPQLVMYFFTDRPHTLIPGLLKNKGTLLKAFDRNEDRFIGEKLFEPGKNPGFREKMRDKLGFSLRLPPGYKEAKFLTGKQNDPGLKAAGVRSFLWYRLDTRDIISNILVYSKKSNGGELPGKEKILRLRNRVAKAFVEGPSKDSYMQTEPLFKHKATPITLDGRPGVKIAGWWHVEGDFMGGPFVQYVIEDSVRDRTIYLEGFLYAAGTRKKKYIKRLENILATFELKNKSAS